VSVRSAPLRILAVSHLGVRGGAQKCLQLLCAHLDRRQFDVQVVVPEEGPFAADLRALGLTVHRRRLRWWAGPPGLDAVTALRFRWGLRRRVDALSELIARERIDLVVSNTSVVPEGALAAARSRIFHVWHLHEMLGQDPGLRPLLPLRRLFRLVDGLSHEVVVVSESAKLAIHEECPELSLRVIHNGIAAMVPEEFRRPKAELFGTDPPDPVVLFVGELSERKGVRHLIEAAKMIQPRHQRARFAIAGNDRGEADRLRRLASELAVTDRVSFLGERTDALNLIASSDVVVLPSLADPLPLTVLEAMALARPVVATRSGGSSEMVVDGETGLLVDPASAEQLAAALGQLLDEPARAEEMGHRGQRRARTAFSVATYVSAFADLFHTVATRPSEGARQQRRDRAAREAIALEGAQPHWAETDWPLAIREAGRRARRRVWWD